MQFSDQQQTAIATVAAWLRIKYAPFFYLGGYAGTGKTTLAKHIASLQNGEVRYAAFTGKAAKVMRAAGCTNARTIHSLIYSTTVHPQTGVITTVLDQDALNGVSLVIIDECSMVDEDLGRDLLSFGVPIMALGDPGQLPPVRGSGYFTAGEPTFMLTDIHRQAKDSPIIRLATAVRERTFRRDPKQVDGLTITSKDNLDPADVTDADAIIVGRNATRHTYNKRLRELKGFKGDFPVKGETLICLRNDRQTGVWNGETFTVKRKSKPVTRPEGKVLKYTLVDPLAEKLTDLKIGVFEHFFQDADRVNELHWKALRGTQQFNYGYALTVHKAQGSQWPRVCVFDQSRQFGEDRHRHLYTAVTRAAEHLTLVI